MRRALLSVAVILATVAVVFQGWDMFARTPARVMLQGNDDSHYYFWLRSAVVDGDWDFANELREAPTLDDSARPELLAQPLTPAGRTRNKYPIGWALSNIPFFLAAHLLAQLTGGPADGWQPVYFVMIWLGQLAGTVASLFLAQRVLARGLPAESAWIGVLAGWLASPLLYYQSARLSMVHGLAFFLTVAVIWLAFHLRDKPGGAGRWIFLGGLSALLVITRPTSAVYLLFPGCIVVRQLLAADTRKAALVGIGWALLPAAAVLLVQLLAWHRVYGSWMPDTYEGEPFHFASPQIGSVLFSPRHGLFYWHPLLLLGAVGYCIAAFRRVFPSVWLVSLLAIIYLNAAWWCWWFGSSFGNRAFEGAVLLFMAGLGYLWERTKTNSLHRQVLGIVIAGCIALNALLLFLFMGGCISKSEPVSYIDIASVLRDRFSTRQK